MQFEDPKSILEAAAARPSRDLDSTALMKEARRLRRARLMAAATGVAVVVVAATASFGLIGSGDRSGPGLAGDPPGCEVGDRRCWAEHGCWNPPPFEVSVFLHDGATRPEVRSLQSEILAQPGVGEVVFFSKRDAYAEFRKIYADQPELWETIPPDALPASLRVSASTEAAVERIHGITSPIVDEVRSGLEIRRRLCGDDTSPPPP